MKLIIVDDEPIVRQGLKAIIDWESYDFTVCDEASDGEEGYTKIMKHNPDLVIMDVKMPEMSGIELTEKLRANGYKGKIIILSGYSDFTYAQSALRFGVISYLLKPVDENELISIVKETKNQIENDYISNLFCDLNSDETRNTLLANIFNKTIRIEAQTLKAIGISTDINPFKLILMDYNQSDVTFSTYFDHWIKNIPSSNRYLLTLEKFTLILLIGEIAIDYFEDQLELLKEHALTTNSKAPFIILGKETSIFSDLIDQYTEYKTIIARQFFFRNKNFSLNAIDLEDEARQVLITKFNLIDTIESLFEAIKCNQLNKIRQYIDTLYLHLKYKDLANEQAIQVVINCIVQLKTLLDQTYDEIYTSLNTTDIINRICNCDCLYEIIQLLKEEFVTFSKTLSKAEDSNIINKIINYVEIHYNEDIKLKEIAQHFNYNPSYLGKLFFNSTGEYFNTYLEKYRLEKAIGLFQNNKLKNAEIALRVGYQNVEYFYKKFKAHTGKSPSEYRKYLAKKKP